MSVQTKASAGVDLLFRRQAESIKTTVASESIAPASGKPSAKPVRALKAPPRHPSNSFRPGLYAAIFDCLATPEALKNGMSREKLTSMVASILGRDPKLVQYAVIIFCSPLNASPTCHRHRSCHEGYGMEKQNGWVRMTLPKDKPTARSE